MVEIRGNGGTAGDRIMVLYYDTKNVILRVCIEKEVFKEVFKLLDTDIFSNEEQTLL